VTTEMSDQELDALIQKFKELDAQMEAKAKENNRRGNPKK